MGIDRGRYDHVPGVDHRIIPVAEHESQAEFTAVAEAETAQDQQRTVKIPVQAVDIAHSGAADRLDGRQGVQLKTDTYFGMFADVRESRPAFVGPSQAGFKGSESRGDILPEQGRIIPAVI